MKTKELKFEIICDIFPVPQPEPYEGDVAKHASHDQLSHGNWARGGGEGGKYSAYGDRAEAIAAREGALTWQDLDEIFSSIEEADPDRSIDDMDDDELRLILENDDSYNYQYNALIREEMEAFADNEGIEYDDSDDLEQFREDGEAYAINTMRRQYGDEIAANYGVSENAFDADSAKSKMENAFNYEDVWSGMEAKVDEVYGDSDSLRVSGYVLGGDGGVVGDFVRTFYRDDDGNYRVEHDRFLISDSDYQGKGFGRGFIEHQENTYIAAGLSRINLYSAWDGAYTWSRAGYDFDPGKIQTSINGLTYANWETSTWSKSDVDTFTSLRTRGSSLNMAAEDFPFPHEFASLPDAKNALRDATVYFEKILTPEGVRLREGAIDADGDGMIFDGTPRERPAPSGSSSTKKP